jgi:hypothetical protein
LSVVQLIKQCLRLLQDGRIKSFGEPAVDRREKITGFAAPILSAPEARQADHRPEFKELCALELRYGGGVPRRKFNSAVTSCAKASSSCCRGIAATALISSCENCRPRAAAICATSLVGARRIEPRQERLLERCRDRRRSNRTRCHVPVAGFYEQAALDHGLGQFLDEQRHAIGPIDDLVGDLLGQDLAAGDVRDHLGAQPARQAIKTDQRHLRTSDPGWYEFWPEGDDRQERQARRPLENGLGDP